MDPVPITRLERDWQRELASGLVARHLHYWQGIEPALAPFGDVEALIRYLRRSSSGASQDAVLAALLRQARHDPVAARLVLQRLLPGLKRRSGRMLIDANEREEFWALLLAQAWEQIRTFPVDRLSRHVAANLVLSIVRDTVRHLAAERTCGGQALLAEPEDPPNPPSGIAALGIDGVLAQAVATGAISSSEADLIVSTRIDGQPLGPIAADQGVGFNTLVQRRRRAERRLLFALLGSGVTWRGPVWPLCGARVSGAGLLGPAGGEDQSTPPRR